MIKPEQVPDSVGEAAMDAVKNGVHDPKAVIAAALNAWPKVKLARNGSSICLEPHVLLPLTQENSDE